MDLTALNQTAVFYALGWAIAHSLWQMGLLWLIYQLVFGLAKNLRPGLRYSAAVLFQAAGFMWFLLTFVSQFNAYQSINRYLKNLPESVSSGTSSIDDETTFTGLLSGERIFNIVEKFIPYLSVAYLFILILLFIRLINAYGYTQKIRTTGLSPVGEILEQRLKDFTQKLSMSGQISIYLSAMIDVPATIGFIKPVILIPVATINHLSTEQVESIILHELAHIRRQDYLLNLMVSVMETVLFFNPFAHLFSVGLKKDRELHCDDFVMAFNRDPKNYATALLSLEKMRSGSAPSLAMAATGENGLLLNRVKRILNIQNQNLRYGEKLIALLFISGLLSALAWLDPVPVEKRPVNPVVTRAKNTNIHGTSGSSDKVQTLSDLISRSDKSFAAPGSTEKKTTGTERKVLRKPSAEYIDAYVHTIPIHTPGTSAFNGEVKSFEDETQKPLQVIIPNEFGGAWPDSRLLTGNQDFPPVWFLPGNGQGEYSSAYTLSPDEEIFNNQEFLRKVFEEFRSIPFSFDNSSSAGTVVNPDQMEKLRLLFHGRKVRTPFQVADSIQNSRKQKRTISTTRIYQERTKPQYRYRFNNEPDIAEPDSLSEASEWYFSPNGNNRVRKSGNTWVEVRGRKETPERTAKNKIIAKSDAHVAPEPYKRRVIKNSVNLGSVYKELLSTSRHLAYSPELSPDMSMPEKTKEASTPVRPRSANVVSDKKNKGKLAGSLSIENSSEGGRFLIVIETGNESIQIRVENQDK